MTTVSSFTLITATLYDLFLTMKDPKIKNNEKIYEASVLLSWVVINIANFQFINFISAQTVHEVYIVIYIYEDPYKNRLIFFSIICSSKTPVLLFLDRLQKLA